MSGTPVTPAEPSVLVDGLDHAEGVAWDPQAAVVWAGGEAGQLYRVDPVARTVAQVATAPDGSRSARPTTAPCACWRTTWCAGCCAPSTASRSSCPTSRRSRPTARC